MKFFTAVVALAGASSTLALRGVLPNNMKELLNDKFAAFPVGEKSECSAFWKTVECMGSDGSRNTTYCQEYAAADESLATCTNTICDSIYDKEGYFCVQGHSDVEEEDMVATPACDICSALYVQTIECEDTHQCKKAYKGVNATDCPVTCNHHFRKGKSYCVQGSGDEDVDATN